MQLRRAHRRHRRHRQRCLANGGTFHGTAASRVGRRRGWPSARTRTCVAGSSRQSDRDILVATLFQIVLTQNVRKYSLRCHKTAAGILELPLSLH